MNSLRSDNYYYVYKENTSFLFPSLYPETSWRHKLPLSAVTLQKEGKPY